MLRAGFKLKICGMKHWWGKEYRRWYPAAPIGYYLSPAGFVEERERWYSWYTMWKWEVHGRFGICHGCECCTLMKQYMWSNGFRSGGMDTHKVVDSGGGGGVKAAEVKFHQVPRLGSVWMQRCYVLLFVSLLVTLQEIPWVETAHGVSWYCLLCVNGPIW